MTFKEVIEYWEQFNAEIDEMLDLYCSDAAHKKTLEEQREVVEFTIAALRGQMDWISVRDRLPEDQVEVLVATRSKNGVRNIDKGYLAIDHFIHRGRAEVTHWMPLPELPKEEK